MEILLINVTLRPDSKLKLFPIGLGYIATAINRANFQFDLIDIDAYRYDNQEVESLIKQQNYDVVCMGCIVTGYKYVKNLCKIIRLHHPKAKIIVGNSVGTSVYEILLNNTEADIVVMGEGDITIVELLDTLDKGKDLAGVDGICYKSNNKINRNKPRMPIEDISKLPFVDFSLFDAEIYIKNSSEQVNEGVPIPRNQVRALPINTARGCIAHCTFCYHNFQGYKYRYRTMDSVIAEIKDMIEKYNLNYILLSDELTLFSRKRAEEFADAIIESDLHFYWAAACRADCFIYDEDIKILEKMKRAGCVSMGYSLESSNSNILKAMNKHICVEHFAKTTELMYKAGITPNTSIVIGYPQETIETIKATFECCAVNRIYPSTGYLLPQPGSVMYEYAKSNNYIMDEEAFLLRMGDRQDLRINMTQISDEDMEKAVLDGLKKCNECLHIGLDEQHLIKTQYYRASK